MSEQQIRLKFTFDTIKILTLLGLIFQIGAYKGELDARNDKTSSFINDQKAVNTKVMQDLSELKNWKTEITYSTIIPFQNFKLKTDQ